MIWQFQCITHFHCLVFHFFCLYHISFLVVPVGHLNHNIDLPAVVFSHTGTVFHWSLNRAPEPDRGGQSQGPLLAIMFTAETVT